MARFSEGGDEDGNEEGPSNNRRLPKKLRTSDPIMHTVKWATASNSGNPSSISAAPQIPLERESRQKEPAMVEEEYEEESEDEWGTSWFESSEDDEEIEQQIMRSGNEVQPTGARVNSSPNGNGTGPESVESCGDTPSPISVQADVAASVRGELPALVRHGIPTSVQEEMRAFVRQEVLALIRQELPALVRQEVLALVRQELPALVRRELPALVRRELSSFRQQGLYDLDGFYDRQLELNTTLEPSNLTDDGGRQDEMTLCDRYTEGLVSVGSSGSASIGNGNGTGPESVESCGDTPLPPLVYVEVNTTLESSNLSDDVGRRDEMTLHCTEGAASWSDRNCQCWSDRSCPR